MNKIMIMTLLRKRHFLPAYFTFVGIWMSSIACAAQDAIPPMTQTQEHPTPIVSSYKVISDLYLPSLPVEKKTTDVAQSPKVGDKAAVEIPVQNLSQRDMMETVYEIFAKTDTRQPSKVQQLQNSNLFADTSMFCGSKAHPEHNVFKHMFEDKLNTNFGRAAL